MRSNDNVRKLFLVANLILLTPNAEQITCVTKNKHFQNLTKKSHQKSPRTTNLDPAETFVLRSYGDTMPTWDHSLVSNLASDKATSNWVGCILGKSKETITIRHLAHKHIFAMDRSAENNIALRQRGEDYIVSTSHITLKVSRHK